MNTTNLKKDAKLIIWAFYSLIQPFSHKKRALVSFIFYGTCISVIFITNRHMDLINHSDRIVFLKVLAVFISIGFIFSSIIAFILKRYILPDEDTVKGFFKR
jgi:hypothetical protein